MGWADKLNDGALNELWISLWGPLFICSIRNCTTPRERDKSFCSVFTQTIAFICRWKITAHHTFYLAKSHLSGNRFIDLKFFTIIYRRNFKRESRKNQPRGTENLPMKRQISDSVNVTQHESEAASLDWKLNLVFPTVPCLKILRSLIDESNFLSQNKIKEFLLNFLAHSLLFIFFSSALPRKANGENVEGGGRKV